MSLRRSLRNANSLAPKTDSSIAIKSENKQMSKTLLTQNLKKESTVVKKESASVKKEPVSVKKETSKVKKEYNLDSDISSLLSADVPLKTAMPKNWQIVYDGLEAYREVHKAPVDTMGCERLAQNDVSPIDQRFQTLISLMLSSQTKDTVTSVAVWKLQAELPGGLNLQSILNVDEAVLDNMIRTVGFHTKKAGYIKKTAVILRDQYGGDIPDTIEGLVSLPGVGPKMGYLTLQVAWNKNLGIGVDVHVHRMSNRLGWVKTKNPEETREKLQSWLPKDKWRKINPIMVGYGQLICLPRNPLCNACPINQYCPSSEAKKVKKQPKKRKGDEDENEDEKLESNYFKKEKIEANVPNLDW